MWSTCWIVDSQTSCDYYDSYDYSDPVFRASTMSRRTVAARHLAGRSRRSTGGQQYTALMIVTIVSDADWDALDQLFATFNVLQ